jgi:hypothetical protein
MQKISLNIRYYLNHFNYWLYTDKICRLCLQRKKLQKESHIISRFLYKGVFDKDKKLNKLRPYDVVHGNKKSKQDIQ